MDTGRISAVGAALALSAIVAACQGEAVEVTRPPTAFAGFDAPAALGAPVVLDGRRSIDPDGDPLSFAWSLVASPADSTATLSAPDAPVTTLVPDIRGTYLVALTVSDGALVDRDLVALQAGGDERGPALRLEMRTAACNLAFGPDGLSGPCAADGQVRFEVERLVGPATATVAWSVVRAPAGVDLATLEAGARVGQDAFRFEPPTSGEYWVTARLVSPAAVSAPVYGTALVHAPGRPRPAPVIDGPRTAAVRDRIVLDARGSDLPTGADARYRWRLFRDPSAGTASLVDRATGCLPEQCQRFTPDTPGVYVVALEIGAVDAAGTATGAAALHTIEVEE